MLGGRMGDVIGKLTSAQALKIVERLSRKDGTIRDAVVAEAMNVLADFSLDETAGEVFDILDSIDVQDCRDRSGDSPHGHTSPHDAAIDLVEEALQPYFDQAERYHELAMPDQEAAYCQAVMLGIYLYAHESDSEFRKWSADIPAACAGYALERWRERNPDQAPTSTMRAFVRARCPKWANRLKGKPSL